MQGPAIHKKQDACIFYTNRKGLIHMLEALPAQLDQGCCLVLILQEKEFCFADIASPVLLDCNGSCNVFMMGLMCLSLNHFHGFELMLFFQSGKLFPCPV